MICRMSGDGMTVCALEDGSVSMLLVVMDDSATIWLMVDDDVANTSVNNETPSLSRIVDSDSLLIGWTIAAVISSDDDSSPDPSISNEVRDALITSIDDTAPAFTVIVVVSDPTACSGGDGCA